MKATLPRMHDGALEGPFSVRAEHRSHAVCGAAGRRSVTHAYAVLAFYTSGTARYEQNGIWTARAGDMVLVPAGMAHRTLQSTDASFWGASIAVPSLRESAVFDMLEGFERVRDGGAAVVSLPDARHAHVQSLFRELHDATQPDASGRGIEAVQHSLLTLILAEVERAQARTAVTRGGGVVSEALRYIERNCLSRLSLEDVAAAVGRTPSYVTNALSRATGQSAGAWIVQGKLAEARRLLVHSDVRIEQIVERIGYADVTHFIRMFRRAHGVTPAAYRAQHRR